MRRREKYAHAVWLCGFEGDPDSRNRATQGITVDSVAGTLHQICGRHGYLVEMEQHGDVFEVRCFPVRPRLPLGQPPVSLLYKGSSLRNILASALLELARLRNLERRYSVCIKEHVRWVA